MSKLCSLALHTTVKKVLNNKPWFKHEDGGNFIEVIPMGNITEYNINEVVTKLNNSLNRMINDGRELGNIFYETLQKEYPKGVHILPTDQQLALLNAEDEAAEREARKEWESEEHQRILNQRLQEIEGEEQFFEQTPDTASSTASPETIAMIKNLIKAIGVDISSVQNIVVNGVKMDANGTALLMQKLVQVVEGKESTALPEEAMHFVVAIIKQTNPSLYRTLLSEINKYEILNTVNREYRDIYKTKEGRPDIIKLKEEAIAKLLTEVVINKMEGSTEKPELLEKVDSWWEQMIDWLRRLFIKSGFDRLAIDIIAGKEIGTAEDIQNEEVFLQLGNQENIINKLKEISSQIEKKADGYYINGKKIPRRVTDLVKDWYSNKFKNNQLVESDYEKAVHDLKAEEGTAGHSAFEYAFSRLVDENGYIRDTELDDSDYDVKFDKAFYKILKDNLRERLKSFPKGTRFMSEITVYDSKRNLAGTLDFLSVEPNGKVHILDWKFMNLNVEKYEDVPWYKVSAWNTQMSQYVKIIQDVYGVKTGDFGQKRMIPILTTFDKGDPKKNILPLLTGVKIGAVDPKKITDDYLLPVGMENESTGERKIDKYIEKLNAQYKRLSERKISPEEKKVKADQLNALFKAIRHLQMKGDIAALISQIRILNKYVERLTNRYNTEFKGKEFSTISDEQRNAFLKDIDDYMVSLSIYPNIYTELKFLFQGELSGEEKKLMEDLRDVADDASHSLMTMTEMLDEFAEEYIAKSENVNDYMAPEKVVRGIPYYFSTTATIQLKSVQILYKKANRQLALAAMETLAENKKLMEMKKSYDDWANSKGLSKKEWFSIIKDSKKKNTLISEFDSEFYKQLRTKIAERDFTWIRDNINVSEYNKFLKEKLDIEIAHILDRPDLYTADEYREIERAKQLGPDSAQLPFILKSLIEKQRRLHDTSTTESAGWLLYDYILKFPKEKWESKEWKEINKPENKPAKDLYDYIKERNEEYSKFDYIGKKESRVFLPFVAKGVIEKLITKGDVRLGENFFRSISVDESDIGYGKIDKLTGQPVNTIPKYFTNDVDGQLSDDLFRNMALYNEAALKYKYVRQIEYQIRALVNVERNKKAIATSRFGKTLYKEGVEGEFEYTPDNNSNTELLESMMKAIIYDQKYVSNETFDQLLGKIGSWGDVLNKKLGIKIFPDNLSEKQISVNKVLTEMNNIFQLNTLGLNLLSATSNLFGGNVQSVINAGKYFIKSDYIASEANLFINKLHGEDQKKAIAALEYFLPLTENYNREIAKKLSVNTLTGESLQDGLMVLMRHSDWNVQTASFFAYLKNTIVLDGKLINVREHLRSQPKYQNFYKLSAQERQRINLEFEEEVTSLINSQGVMKLATVENGKLVIPGIENLSESVIELRRKVQQLSKDALGNLSADDVRMINLNVYGKSFMVFKNWIPRLIDVRVSNLKYNSALDAYEWGRMRTVYRVIAEDLSKALGNLHGSIVANEKGIEFLRELYEKKSEEYKKDTGKTLEMTEDQFIDLVRANIKNQVYDVVFLVTMFMLVAALKANAPDDDEDPIVRNQYRFILRMSDKFKSELSYFYDPTGIIGIASRGIFPSVGLIENFSKGLKNFFIENWGLIIGDDELVEDTKVIKYWMKTFPFTNQVVGYLPMFYPELAKDLGVKIQSNYGIK